MTDLTTWRWDLSWPILTAALCTVVLAGALGIINWRRNGKRQVVGVLEGLRFIAISLLVITLLRPERVETISREEEPVILALLDESGSMKTRDVMSEGSVYERSEWIALKTREDAPFWSPLKESGTTVARPFSSPKGEGATDLAAPLIDALERFPNLKAAITLTDGDWNHGQSPLAAASRYRSKGIPIYTVRVGSDSALPDVSLEHAAAPPVGLLGEQLDISYLLRNDFPSQNKFTLELLEGDIIVRTENVIAPSGKETHGSIHWEPSTDGEKILTLRVVPTAGETFSDNNERQMRVRIDDKNIRVLVVDSLPRWEYRYLRNALERDPKVDLNCTLFHPDLEMGGGRGYLNKFPSSPEELAVFDVVFLGDIGIGNGELTIENAEHLADLIRLQAAGVVFIPGFRGRQMTFRESPLADFLPVVFDEDKPNGVGMQNEANLVLTTSGKDHRLTNLEKEKETNYNLWRRLPGFRWSAGVTKSRPGAKVLAVHSNLRNQWGPLPLLAIKTIGSGKSLFLGTVAAWWWRRGVEDKYHRRFWKGVARWMAHQRHLAEKEGIRLIYSPESPLEGDRVFLHCHVFDFSGLPIRDEEVEGRISYPSGVIEEVRLTAVEGGWGVYAGSFLARESGITEIQARAPNHDREIKVRLQVDGIPLERLGRPAKSDDLRELSRLTGGRFGFSDKLQAIVEEIAALPDPLPQVKIQRFWSNPWWGGTIIFLFAIYWTGRKLVGMM